METLMTTAPPWGVEIVKLLSGVISYVDNTNIWRRSVAGLLIIFSRSAIDVDLSKLFYANFCDPLLRNEPCGRLEYHWVSHDIHNTTWGRGTAQLIYDGRHAKSKYLHKATFGGNIPQSFSRPLKLICFKFSQFSTHPHIPRVCGKLPKVIII